MQFDHLKSNKDDGLMSIEDLRALRLHKKKIENDKKGGMLFLKYIQYYLVFQILYKIRLHWPKKRCFELSAQLFTCPA